MINYYEVEKPRTINRFKNILLLGLVYIATVVLFNLNFMEIAVWTICTVMILLLKANVPISIILTLFFLVPSDYTSFMQVKTPIGAFPYYWVLMVVFILYYVILDNIKNIYFTKTEINISVLFIVFSACQLICTLLYNNDNITINLLQFLFQSIGMMFLMKLQNPNENDLNRTFYYIIFLVAVVDFAAFCEIFLGVDFYNVYHIGYYHDNYVWAMSQGLYWRSYSTFGNPLVYSGTLMLCLTIVEFFRKNEEKFFLQLILLSLIVSGSLLSGSRSAIIISLIYVIYYIGRSKFSKKIALIILILIAVPILFHVFNIDHIIYNFQVLGQSKSAAHRVEAYKLFGDVFSQYILLGTGLGNSYSILNNYVGRANNFMTNTFDNAFMDFSLAIGIVGIIIFILIAVNVIDLLSDKRNKIGLYCFIFFCMISFVMNATKYISLWGLLWTFIAFNAYVVEDECSILTNE
jgi:hypothetical protein